MSIIDTPTPALEHTGAVVISMDPRAAADAVGVSERDVRNAIADQELPASRIGRRIVVRPADLDAWAVVNRLDLTAASPE